MNTKRTKAERIADAQERRRRMRETGMLTAAGRVGGRGDSGPARVLRLATLQDCIDEYGSAILDDAHMLKAIEGGHYVVLSGGRESRLRTVHTSALVAEGVEDQIVVTVQPPTRAEVAKLFDGLSVHDKKRGS